MLAYFIDNQGRWQGASAERKECPKDAVTTPPDCEYPRWDGKGWVKDTEQEAEVLEQQKESLIHTKMREMAKAELIKDGKL